MIIEYNEEEMLDNFGAGCADDDVYAELREKHITQ